MKMKLYLVLGETSSGNKERPSMIRHLRKSHLEARKDWTQVMLLGEAVCVQGSIAACMATLTRPCLYHSSRVVFVQSTLI